MLDKCSNYGISTTRESNNFLLLSSNSFNKNICATVTLLSICRYFSKRNPKRRECLWVNEKAEKYFHCGFKTLLDLATKMKRKLCQGSQGWINQCPNFARSLLSKPINSFTLEKPLRFMQKRYFLLSSTLMVSLFVERNIFCLSQARSVFKSISKVAKKKILSNSELTHFS